MLQPLQFLFLYAPAAVLSLTLPRDFNKNPAQQYLSVIQNLDISGLSDTLLKPFQGKYKISQQSGDGIFRNLGITTKRLSFLYGPPVAGGPSFPTGPLGLAKVASDLVALQQDVGPQLLAAVADDTQSIARFSNVRIYQYREEATGADAAQYNNLQTLDDYVKLYDGNWKGVLPKGPDLGSLTNYTLDSFFSMQRLSNSPYAIRRLNPASDTLSFRIPDSTSKQVSGNTINELFQAGRLFFADYSDQKDLERVPGAYSAACEVFYYIHSDSGDFLPLAIRTNVGSNLIYTPADSKEDWLLAKIMVNVNDFWYNQWRHLASIHEVVQITYMAAIRTLSDEHPVHAWMNRLMYQVFSIQPTAALLLFAPGMIVDSMFAFSGRAAQDYTTGFYAKGDAGRFKSSYFLPHLQSRAMVNPAFGPALKDFPFYEDGSVIHASIHKFMEAFVNSFYGSDNDVTDDAEIQAWVKEAQGEAQAIDFPSIRSRDDLVDVLTHIAHLVSVSHHTINTNQLLDISATLPTNPAALSKAPPTEKGVKNVADYLPKFDKLIVQFTTGALFARPKLAGTKRSLIHMFDDADILQRMNTATTKAAATFKKEMEALSSKVSSRTFDANGLCQGMPFIWHALDPNVAPYSVTT